jgi:hypothetical protein
MIEVDDWIHVQPKDLSCDHINPTQLNKYKNRVQEPHFILKAGSKDVMVNGRKIFWSLLDSLFPHDKLPRTPVNADLQYDPNDFVQYLNGFFQESTTPYISIMLGEIYDPKSTVEASYSEPGAVIITANSGLKAPDCVAIADRYNGLVISGTWRDSKGNHEVPCVLINGCVHIHDLGDQLIVGAVFKNEHGDNVRPLPLDAVRKAVGWPSALASIIEKHIQATEAAEGRTYPPSNGWKPTLTSSQTMAKEFELFMRGHQD